MLTTASVIGWIVAAFLDYVPPMWAAVIGGPMSFVMIVADTALSGDED